MPKTPKSTGKTATDKPQKPYPDFPLFPHATKRWAKKIRGKLHYFGKWDDPQAAADKYNEQRDDLYAGRTPRAPAEGLTVRDLVNRFLTAKKNLLDSGELANRTFLDYHATCKNVGDAFGLTRLVTDLASDDFEQLRARIAKGRGPTTLGNEVQRVRVLFKYADDAGLIDRPMRFGPTFRRPSKKVLRKVRQAKGPRMFEAKQLLAIISKASQPMKAMVLLGINCGFGNTDCATLPKRSINLKTGWVEYPRPKTGIERRAKLWPETIKALKEAIAERPNPKGSTPEELEKLDQLTFLTRRGRSWGKQIADDPVSKEFSKLIRELKIHRPGLGFYALRHTLETIGGESLDQVAVDAIMGHAPASNDMASVYRERVTDERLKAVSNHVRKWLFPPAPKKKKTPVKRKLAINRAGSDRLTRHRSAR